MNRPRNLKLRADLGDQVVRFCELMGISPDELIDDAVECYLRDRVAIRARIIAAQARAQAELRSAAGPIPEAPTHG